MDKNLVVQTRRHYNLIAKEWDISRPFLKPERKKLASKVKEGERVLDVGCGNGVLYEFLASKSIDYTGLDFSLRLLRIARKRAARVVSKRHPERSEGSCFKFVLGEATNLPFKNNTFDWVFAFAVYHHLPSSELRQKAVNEARRVLLPGGKLVLTVWNVVSEFARKKYKIKKDDPDVFIPWKATAGKVVSRYIHVFKIRELRDLLKKAGFKNIRFEKIYRGSPAERVKSDNTQGYDLAVTAIK